MPNRLLLNDRLAQAMAVADRHGDKLALLYLDLDRFKHINDSLARGQVHDEVAVELGLEGEVKGRMTADTYQEIAQGH